MEGVGEELLSIPLKADCQVPVVELESKDLAYGECFVRFHEPRTLVLVNTSTELTGLFRVVPQSASTYSVARVSPEPEEGQVLPLLRDTHLSFFLLFWLQATTVSFLCPPATQTLAVAVFLHACEVEPIKPAVLDNGTSTVTDCFAA